MVQKNHVIKEHFLRVLQTGIVRSWLPENFKLLTLPVLEIWSIMCSQNGHLKALCSLILKIKSFKVQIIHIASLNIDAELFASYKDTYLLHFAILFNEIGLKIIDFLLKFLKTEFLIKTARTILILCAIPMIIYNTSVYLSKIRFHHFIKDYCFQKIQFAFQTGPMLWTIEHFCQEQKSKFL